MNTLNNDNNQALITYKRQFNLFKTELKYDKLILKEMNKMAPDEMFQKLDHKSDDRIKEVLDCYDLKELKKLKKKYGTVKVSMNYNINKINPKDWEDIDYVIFYQTLVITLYKKEHKSHLFTGKTVAIVPDWYDCMLIRTAKILPEENIIEYKNNAMNLIWWELKFNYKLKSMKQIKVYA